MPNICCSNLWVSKYQIPLGQHQLVFTDVPATYCLLSSFAWYRLCFQAAYIVYAFGLSVLAALGCCFMVVLAYRVYSDLWSLCSACCRSEVWSRSVQPEGTAFSENQADFKPLVKDSPISNV